VQAEDYLKIIVGFAIAYAIVTFIFVGTKTPSKAKGLVEVMTPTFFVSIAVMGLTALGYIK
jgi:hypothetical protein